MKISLLHPSRGRPEKASDTLGKWWEGYIRGHDFDHILSIDEDDPLKQKYFDLFPIGYTVIVNKNKSAVDAINRAAEYATGEIFIVVSDDTNPLDGWVRKVIREVEGKTDWILKTQDGIQNYIITMPVMDRAYYERTGYIYHPDFQHLFCDTYLTCVADITGRKITSNLLFKHNHYSVNGTPPDDLHKRNDATWKQGQETFIKLMKQFTRQERARIKDPGMRSWLRNHGV